MCKNTHSTAIARVWLTSIVRQLNKYLDKILWTWQRMLTNSSSCTITYLDKIICVQALCKYVRTYTDLSNPGKYIKFLEGWGMFLHPNSSVSCNLYSAEKFEGKKENVYIAQNLQQNKFATTMLL